MKEMSAGAGFSFFHLASTNRVRRLGRLCSDFLRSRSCTVTRANLQLSS